MSCLIAMQANNRECSYCDKIERIWNSGGGNPNKLTIHVHHQLWPVSTSSKTAVFMIQLSKRQLLILDKDCFSCYRFPHCLTAHVVSKKLLFLPHTR